ncbi:hypothetical protein J6590_041633 [Homalodisca vitripennis]|nr:hypothetical protein J6590_041633 [Homalodisca vitripennis]
MLTKADFCPGWCSCETAQLSGLPINSVLVLSQYKKPAEEQLPSYQHRNEVLDESDENEAKHQLGEEKLKAATCVLQPADNLPLFASLPPDLQVLTILQGPGTSNLTLDETYFQHLTKLVVLELHGFLNGQGLLRLKNNALKHLELLRYLNIQHLQLMGDRSLGNRPVPVSGTQFIERNMIPGAVRFSPAEDEIESNAIQFIPEQTEAEIVPYTVYREQQERAGLSTFAGLRSLIFLRAFHCNIKEVNWEMFDGLNNLEYLSLEGNKIPFIHEFSFYGTPNLKHLVVSHNKLLDVQSTSLAGLLKLEILDLSYNNISHLSELSLPPLPNLVTADFHHNPIELILPYTFQIMNSTEQLYLGKKNTQLQIRHNSFLGLDKVRKVSLNGVYLEMLEREYLIGMPRLRQLKMEGSIYELSFDAFAEVPKLQELILKQCSIRKISMDAFFGLYNLTYLDLSHNELETLPPSLFDHQESLKEINLSNNKLTTLPEDLFVHVPAKLIRLDKNPWHCTCSMYEWKPSQINKIKVKVIDDSLCQNRYDKGSMCRVRYIYRYMYEQSVTPLCASPTRFSGWSVFHLLRKHLRCYKKLHKNASNHVQKYKKAIHKKFPKFHKNHNSSLESSVVTQTPITNEVDDQNVQTDEKNTTTSEQTNRTTLHTASTEVILLTKDSEQTTETNILSTNRINDNGTLETNNDPEESNTIDINQNMWTQKDKDKYRLLQEKYEKTQKQFNSTETVNKDKPVQANVKLNIDMNSKIKKRTDTQKKWSLKMENTVRRLNMVPTN